jgi:hypothetical protein
LVGGKQQCPAAKQQTATSHCYAKKYKTFRLEEGAFRQLLAAAPLAKNGALKASSFVITIPNASGGVESFKIAELPVMSAQLAARYPQLKSYLGQA